MKAKRLLVATGVLLAILGGVQRSSAQGSPGTFADANQPSGAPDPEKLDEIWSVDPINGQVSINIPFATTPQGGRGPKIPFALMYNSGSSVTLQAASGASGGGTIGGGFPQTAYSWSAHPIASLGNVLTAPSGPWTTTGPFYQLAVSNNVPDSGYYDFNGKWQVTGAGCNITGPYNYTDPEGATHDLNLLSFFSGSNYASEAYAGMQPSWVPICGGAVQSASYWPNSATGDGSAIAASSGTAIGPDGTIGGTVDSNGNRVSISLVNGVTTVTDALGRTVYITNIPIGVPGQIPVNKYYVTTYGPNGNTETYWVKFSNVNIGSFIMPHPTLSEITSAQYCGPCDTVTTLNQPKAGDSLTAVTEIDLPDESTSYKFTYDQVYGTISTITFPTGGTVSFTWGIRDRDWSPYGQYDAISAIVVTSASVSAGGTASEWTYDMESLSTSSVPFGRVHAPDQSRTDYTGSCFVFTTVPFYSYQPRKTCKESSHATYSSSGALLASQAETFTGSVLPIQVVTTTYDGLTPLQKQVVNTYDAYSNVTEKDESDYYTCTPTSSGATCPIPSATQEPFLRKTYMTPAYRTKSALLAAHIVDKPGTVIITDGNGNPYSLTTYSYDGHGNLLNESKCLSISGTGSSATCGSSLNTSYYYDGTGQLTCKVDGPGLGSNKVGSCTAAGLATTSYTWSGPSGTADGYNGFVTNVLHPNGASDSYTYYAPTGQVATHTDWNLNKTTYNYSDPLNRPTSIVAPATTDGTPGSSSQGQGTTTYYYTDTAGAFSVQEQHTVNTLGTKTLTTTSFDGLGRKITIETVTPQCASPIEVDTTYDSMSRIHLVSNPYCSTFDSTYGLTTFAYDALGRKTQTTNPDNTPSNNSISTITYGGNATEFTDPPNGAGYPQHIQQVNGLGQLTSVCEVSASTFGGASPTSCGLNITGTGYLTSYTYDPLGNLRNVNQHGISRSFIYDSLSRLTYAMNPEAGATTYGYLTTSNTHCSPNPAIPCSKTDARGVTVSYTYDILSRFLSKTYSSSGASTPLSCYQYDAGTGTNPKGHLTNAWTQPASSGSCSPSPGSFINLKSFLNYDAVGRLLNAQQQTCVGGSCSGPSPYMVSMAYDLIGNLTTLNNSVGANNQPLTLTNYFDSASRPCLTTSSWTANASPNLFQINPTLSSTSPGYSPAGGLQNYSLGSSASTASTSCSSSPTSPINAVLNYTKRFWVSGISVTGQIP